MKNQILTEQSRHLTDMIREQTDTVLGYENRIPQIELDILLENVRKLYEALKELEKRNASLEFTPEDQQEPVASTIQTPIDVILPVEVPIEALDVEMETASDNPMQPEALLASVEIPVEAPRSEISTEEVMPQAMMSKESPKPVAKSATLFDEDVPTIAERFTSAPSVHDRIASARHDDSISAKWSSNPISDLKKAIGINEKFALINELFEGDINAYNDAIDVLNNASDEHQALQYLNATLASKYGWDTSDESYLKLRHLVERRY